MSAPEWMDKRWRVKTENFRNDPESLKALEDEGFVGLPRFLASTTLETEEARPLMLLPPMSPGFCEVLGHICELHNASLGVPS